MEKNGGKEIFSPPCRGRSPVSDVRLRLTVDEGTEGETENMFYKEIFSHYNVLNTCMRR